MSLCVLSETCCDDICTAECNIHHHVMRPLFVVKAGEDMQRSTEVCEACGLQQRAVATEHGGVTGQNAWRNEPRA